VIALAMSILSLAGLAFLARLVVGPSLADRVVALDGLVATIVAATVLHVSGSGSARFVDVAVVVAFVGFVGTAAAARYIERRGG